MITEAESDRIPEILFVDSDPDAVPLYIDIFKDTAYHLHIAGTVQDGIDQAIHYLPDLIFVSACLFFDESNDFIKNIRANIYLQTSVIIVVHKERKALDITYARSNDINVDEINLSNKHDIMVKVPLLLKIKFLNDKQFQSNKRIKEYRNDIDTSNLTIKEQKRALTENRKILTNSLKQISMMVDEREQMSQTILELQKSLKDSYDGLIMLLSSTIESKRQYHKDHSRRVAVISTFIARKFELPEKQIRDIETAALLHEIGKLSIPDDLLMKHPNQYTPTEKCFVNLHPVSGSAILENFPDFSPVANIVRHIHESVDGKGIPDKLRKEDIPIGSRIIAVASIFENLVYQDGNRRVEDAFRTIDEMLNIRFDPKIVYYLHEYADLNPLDEQNRTEAISLYELEPGMELAASIYTRSGAILLPMKTILTEESIKRIARYTREEPIEGTVFIR